MGLDSLIRSIPGYGAIYSSIAGPSDAEQQLLAQFQQMANDYQQYRGLHANARTQQLQTGLQNFAPVQQALSSMAPSLQPFNTQGAMNAFQGVTNGMGPAAAYGKTRVGGR